MSGPELGSGVSRWKSPRVLTSAGSATLAGVPASSGVIRHKASWSVALGYPVAPAAEASSSIGSTHLTTIAGGGSLTRVFPYERRFSLGLQHIDPRGRVREKPHRQSHQAPRSGRPSPA